MLVPETFRESFLGVSLNVELGLRDFDDLMDGLSPAIMQCLRELGRDVALPGSCSAHL